MRFTKRNYLIILAISALFFLANITTSFTVGISKKQSSNPAPHPGLAVSGLSVKNVKQWNMQLVYQDLISSSIDYRISTNKVNYSAGPSHYCQSCTNPRLAATSFESPDGTTFPNVFYILNSQTVLANMTCPVLTPASCSTLTNTGPQISSKPGCRRLLYCSCIPRFGVKKGFRIFCHNTNHEVTELALINGTERETMIASAAPQGTSLAAVTVSALGYMQVVYMDGKANTIFTIENTNGNWLLRALPSVYYMIVQTQLTKSATLITALIIPSLPPTTSLTLS
jgi:hypothetical protein